MHHLDAFNQYFGVLPTDLNVAAIIEHLDDPERALALMIASRKDADQIVVRLALDEQVSLDEAALIYELLEQSIRLALRRAGCLLEEDLNDAISNPSIQQ